jgi:hypothetical protein
MSGHAILGASNAHRWLECPGSVEAERDIPNTTSPFAAEGTEAHELAETALRMAHLPPEHVEAHDYDRYAHIKSHEWLDLYENAEMADFVRVYVDYVNNAAKGADVFEIEQRVSYADWVDGGFGTADAVIIKDGVIHVCDLKYGMGVRVDAENNPQGMLYALGAYAENKWLGDIHTARISIVQPRLDHISEWEISIDALLRWAEWVKQRAEATAEPDAPRVPGEKQCRFCRAKASCQALRDMTEAVILSEFDDLDNMPKANALTDAQMRAALEAKPLIESWLSAIEALVKDRLSEGETFDGFKLVEGRSNRRWADDAEAEKALVSLLDDKAFAPRKIVSPAQAEKALGKKRAGEVADLIVKPSGAPTLVNHTDPRPALGVTPNDFNDCAE